MQPDDAAKFMCAAVPAGYQEMFKALSKQLIEITGFDDMSLQPNSGASGEYAGLMAIRAYHKSRGESHRDVCIIPVSAHGTNPASAAMCGMKIVVVGTDEQGNINIPELTAAAEKHSANLAALMVTYPSTHGVYEDGIAAGEGDYAEQALNRVRASVPTFTLKIRHVPISVGVNVLNDPAGRACARPSTSTAGRCTWTAPT